VDPQTAEDGGLVTLIWLIAWFIADQTGDRAPLLFDPVNLWAGLLLLAIAIDLAASHATRNARKG
jgi:hypothetical protein